MKTKHTKGDQWIISKNYKGVVVQDRILIPGTFPMDVHVATIDSADLSKVEANAKLIAAAPELLDALVNLNAEIGGIPVDQLTENQRQARIAASKAIKKATE